MHYHKKPDLYSKTFTMEYYYCLDSSNVLESYLIDNPTNDILLKVQMSSDKLIFSKIELVGLELPETQRLIELGWNKLYYMTVLDMPVGGEIIIKDDMIISKAEFPPTLNAIVAIDDVDPLNPIFTTEVPHLLDTAFPVWPYPWNITGSAVEVVAIEPTWISATQFSISLVSPVTWMVDVADYVFGYLQATALKTYTDFAAVTQAMLLQDYGPISVTFNINTGRTSICLRGDIDDGAVLYVPDSSSLAAKIGFGPGSHPLTKTTLEQCYGPSGCADVVVSSKCVTSRSCGTLGVCSVDICPGRYRTPASMIVELNHVMGRFWLDPEDPLPHEIHISETNGTEHVVAIPCGYYTSYSLSITMTNVLTAVWPAGAITVTDSCEFTANLPFTLDFSNNEKMAGRLGFVATRYSGSTRYTSNLDFDTHPDTSCSSGSCIVTFAETCDDSHQLVYVVAPPPPVAMTVSGATFTSTVLAHGFSVGDLVSVNNGEFILLIETVVSGTEFIVVLSGGYGAFPNSVVVTHVSNGCEDFKFMFAPRNCGDCAGAEHNCNPGTNAYLASVLGFPAQDEILERLSPFVMDLNGRHYTMVEIVSPTGSARVEQLNITNHNNSRFIAKALLINTTVRTIDKTFPMVYHMFPPTRLTRIHIRFLNPDGSLLILHGKRWSMTLKCTVEQPPAETAANSILPLR
jgi:hypothetical protein